MKKLLAIVVLGLLWSKIGYAINEPFSLWCKSYKSVSATEDKTTTTSVSSNYEIYDSVTISLMEGKYKIYGISGVIDYREKSFEDCLKAKNDIIDELKITFKNSKIIDNGTYQTPDYAGDKSKRSQVELLLNQNGGVVSVDCVDWSKEAEKKHGWGDNLSITLYSKEYERFVRSL